MAAQFRPKTFFKKPNSCSQSDWASDTPRVKDNRWCNSVVQSADFVHSKPFLYHTLFHSLFHSRFFTIRRFVSSSLDQMMLWGTKRKLERVGGRLMNVQANRYQMAEHSHFQGSTTCNSTVTQTPRHHRLFLHTFEKLLITIIVQKQFVCFYSEVSNPDLQKGRLKLCNELLARRSPINDTRKPLENAR